MRYEILRPLRIIDGPNGSSISARKIETLLAVLLIRSDHVVAADTLMTQIWGDRLPNRATAGLHVYISQLRKFLHRPDCPSNPIVTQPPGYLLRMGIDELDLHMFVQSISKGRRCMQGNGYQEASRHFESALRQISEPVLGDLCDSQIINRFVTWTKESQLECLEMLSDCHLHMARHRELVGRLYSLVAEYPLHEPFYRQLMLALYRSERRADALSVYLQARETLNQELGLEPCQSLQNTQQAILNADDRLDHFFVVA